ncbi:MAG: hypothetical protein BGO69_08205 [Bacteroidetes bacterium 46-16]|nr:MAG: hypothetical protein BGO69_08205 [Bacteroidetes bacterium 46-16]
MPCVYILYSPAKDTYYCGATTLTASERLYHHLSDYYDAKYTARIKDWEIYIQIDCSSMKQAMAIEKHIKSMKSKKYIRNLTQYPDIIQKLIEKYAVPDS